ncbi:DUF3196 family protein [uncultured Faecalicoccus sp.]|uniref:DUF3196 family protein n=1 Tax=uncultured Faecalicoccus sp. TaxID=1971760 RepID=UPI0025E2C355|nr:DUF3196 family protein [uncultured Faecalicoccus sp.]
MNSYYQSFFEEIKKKIEGNQYQEAYDMIHQEIALPYVPKDCLELLETYQEMCRDHLRLSTSSMDAGKIICWIHGSPSQQENAVPYLRSLNLRQYLDEVQDLLNSKICQERKGELIEYLMEQKIDAPFTIEKGGLEIQFVPSVILPVEEDQGIQAVTQYFEDWFSNEDPSFQTFCLALMEQEVLLRRPFDLSEEEPLPLAKAIVRLVAQAMMRMDEYQCFVQAHQLDKVPDLVLCIEEKENSNGNEMDIE